MALARVFMRESLRPWLQSGLTHVFVQEGQPLSEDQSPVPAEPATVSEVASGAPHGDAPRAPRVAQTQPAAPEGNAAIKPAILDHRDAQWGKLTRLIRHHCHMIWTYWELGHDLLATPCVERRQFLQQCIQSLRLPKGSVAFWPLAVPVEHDLTPDLQWFWRGVSRYGASCVCCFGEQAAGLLSSPASARERSILAPDTSLLVFPSLEALASMPGRELMPHLLKLLEVSHGQ